LKNIISTNIIHEYLFKLSIRASKLVDGKRKVKKKIIEFPADTPFTKAIKEAISYYDQMMLDIEQGLKEPKKLLTIDDIWNEYIEFKSKKGEDDEYRLLTQEIPFYNRHVKKFLGEKTLEEVVPQDILDCREAMIKADGTSYAIKTKLGVNLCISKIFKYYNFTKGKIYQILPKLLVIFIQKLMMQENMTYQSMILKSFFKLYTTIAILNLETFLYGVCTVLEKVKL
jgi:hypothetical protein